MRISRGTSVFLLAFGVWSWIIWITFAKNLWESDRAWAADGSPTGYFIVHAVLTVVSFLLGTAIGVLGWRGVRAHARERSGA
ncbi:SCO4848 family membrane protein [Amycolatopsis sp. NPDC059021]|uniref:SCO4848 family membrane protein n=1 Tax=Amycolatopsis sp. NPDC059021 TaxID=3346704 RepID=UPI0036711176